MVNQREREREGLYGKPERERGRERDCMVNQRERGREGERGTVW